MYICLCVDIVWMRVKCDNYYIYVGMGVAAKLCLEGMEYDSSWIEYLSKKMMNGVMKRIPEVRIE